MTKLKPILIVSLCFISLVLHGQKFVHDENKQVVPVGGNAWIVEGTDSITQDGLTNWSDPSTVCRVYVRVSQAGYLNISLLMSTTSQSQIKITNGDWSTQVRTDIGLAEQPVGARQVTKPGYMTIDLQGISKAGKSFGTLTGLAVSGTALGSEPSYVKNNEGNYFYWGRRGPSVHLRYDIQGKQDIEWFYSEITVPKGNDVIGSYYMANGFGEGYFGMQVNSPSERRILFSVWSPFKTDDPKSIPETDRIVMLKKGEGVYTGEFGNEGSGGQSFLRYAWAAERTYGFLLRAQPDGSNATTYTAWFFAPELNRWTLIASFRRPKKSTYLTGLYSFLENFIPETGRKERMARYGNQWVRDSQGTWSELTAAKFTGDATARKNYRMDYSGGSNSGVFYLRNCGFFDNFTALDQGFTRPATGKPPRIDFSALP